jgi:site-specific DNA-methyltransferase (adenine-specific)
MPLPEPYYQRDGITLYLGDALTITTWLTADILITDPPYGMNYRSNMRNEPRRRIDGDHDTLVRDDALRLWGDTKPGIVFGTWKQPRPDRTSQILIWDKGPGYGPGMGDTSAPYGHSHEEIYLLGRWPKPDTFTRHGSVLTTRTPMSGRKGLASASGHPTPKPVPLMEQLILSTPPGAIIADPFAGAGSTLIAARNRGREVIGVEMDPTYAAYAVERLQQLTLWVG